MHRLSFALAPSFALVAFVACASTGTSNSSDDSSTTNPPGDGGSIGADATTSSDGGTTARDGATVASDSGGTTSASDGAATVSDAANVGPGSYALSAPNVCSNQFSNQDCMKGDESSACAGVCSNSYGGTAANVCSGGVTGVPVNYACPRDMLYGDEMNQAVIDDGYGGSFNYGIVGHDVDNGSGGIDHGLTDACCQCYQLVFDYPAENQAWVNPNSSTSPESAISIPMPLVVQSANTATNNTGDMDIFMGAGGFGANNGCYVEGGTCPGGPCMYSSFPTTNGGMIKAAGDSFNTPSPNACKTSSTQWVTEATLTSSGCATDTVNACGQIVSPNAQIGAETVRSCIQSNGVEANDAGQIPGDYHLNWYIWAKRVECPAHLTEVTGCKLASQGLPQPDPTVTTAAQAKAAEFLQVTSDGTQFNTTQMQDCCMPTCAWQNNVSGKTTGGYNSFYSCDQNGVPWTTDVTRTP